MLYALLCYNDEDAVFSWSKEQDDAVMSALAKVHEPLHRAGRLGPTARLMPTTAATTLRKSSDPPLVIDGPYAEAKDLAKANPGGAYEVRPLKVFLPGALAQGGSAP
jgi:hypothetical protein